MDPVLISRILAGESHVYADVVRTYQHMVYTVCHRIVHTAEDAEEATQDTFIKAYQNLRHFRGTSKFSTWLYSIAYRTAISHARKRNTDGEQIDPAVHMPIAPNDASIEQVEIRSHLEKALASLDPEDASILSFYYLEELSVEEIVTVTGLGASNVKVKLFRSRKKLGEALQRSLGAEAATLLLDDA